MIKNFKLFLEGIDESEHINELSADEYNDQFNLDAIYIDQAFIDDVNNAFDDVDLILSRNRNGKEASMNGPDDTVYIYVDSDYWLYINYDIRLVADEHWDDDQIDADSADDAEDSWDVNDDDDDDFNYDFNDNYVSIYHKIDISDGFIHVPEYLEIVDQKRNRE